VRILPKLFAWTLIALSVALPASAQSVESQPIDGSSLAAAARQPPPFTVTLMSAKSSQTEVLGRGITTEFDVTNNGIRDVALMNAQIVVKDQNEKVLFRVEWETRKAVGAGQTVRLKSRHASIAREDVSGLIRMDKQVIIDLDIYRIAFADGEVVSYRNCFLCLF
jgi:hypothetical protein